MPRLARPTVGHYAGSPISEPMIAAIANGLAERLDQMTRWRQAMLRQKPDARSADHFATFTTRERSRAQISAELRRHGFRSNFPVDCVHGLVS